MEDEQLSFELAVPDSFLSPTGLIPKVNEGEKTPARLKVVPLVDEKKFFENSVGEHTRMMCVHEAARYLGVTEKSLRLRVCRREIPFFKIGRRVFFSRSTLNEWIKRHFVEPKTDRCSSF